MTTPKPQPQEMWAVQVEAGTIGSVSRKRLLAELCVRNIKLGDPLSSARVVRVRVEVVDE